MEIRPLDAVQHQVHAADAQHRHPGVAVIPSERLRLEEFVLFLLELVPY